LDTSKQFVSACVTHLLNLLLAIALSKKDADNNDQCIWYFVTLLFDTTIGLFTSIFILFIIENIVNLGGCENFKSGNYFKEEINTDPHTNTIKKKVIRIDCVAWWIQLTLWILAVVLSKWILYYLQAALVKPLDELSGLLFDGLDQLPILKLMIVLFIFPVVCDGFQFWIIDNFLKKNTFDLKDENLKGEFFEDDVQTAKIGLKSEDYNQKHFIEMKTANIPALQLDNSFSHLAKLTEVQLDADVPTKAPTNASVH